jgi:hypothetical protein
LPLDVLIFRSSGSLAKLPFNKTKFIVFSLFKKKVTQ